MGLRVCLLSPEYPPTIGGLADYTRHLASALSDRDVDVTVLTSLTPPLTNPAADGTEDGRPLNTGVAQVTPAIRHWDFRLGGDVMANLPEGALLHIQYQTGAYGVHPAINFLPRTLRRRRPDAPVVTTFHDLREPYVFPKAGPVRRWAVAQLARHSSAVIATTGADGSRLAEMSPREVTVVPIGTNIPRVQTSDEAAWEMRARWSVPLGAALIGFFGFLHPSKGVPTLLRAVAMLREEGVPVLLALLGASATPGDRDSQRHLKEVQRLGASLGLEASMRWAGFLSAHDLSCALSALDCCVLPYRDGASYGHGTLITALAHGLPIVTTEPSSPATFPDSPPPLESEEHCLVVPREDPAWLARGIKRVLNSERLRDQIQAGALGVAQHFSWESIAERTCAVYERMGSSHG